MSSPALRLHLVTLGVADVARAAAFYEKLGLKRRLKNLEEVAFFDAGGVIVGLFGRAALAEDANVADSAPGFGGFALGYNVASESAVDDALKQAEAAGATILKPAQRAFWGGYHGYFADLDGHPWEVAYNAQFRFDERGQLVLAD